MKRKSLFSALCTWALCVCLTLPTCAQSFPDVPQDHWAFESIEEAVTDGAVRGFEDGKFAPEDPLTMAQFAVILTRAFYGDELAWRTEDGSWRTEEDTEWYAASARVGRDHDLFANLMITDMAAPLSRYDMAAMLYNILQDQGIRVTEEERTEALSAIGDEELFSSPVFYQTVLTAYALDILRGYEDGSFHGDLTLNRAQAAAVYARLKKVLEQHAATPAPQPALTPSPAPFGPQLPIVATPTPQPTATPAPPPDVSEAETFRREVLRLVNEARAEQGLPAMTLGDTLCAAAQVRAEELPSLFEHTRPDGSDFFTALTQAGDHGFTTAGENIAAGQQTPAAVMEAWMASEGHRDNILSPNFHTLGVGVIHVSDSYGIYWCQLFTD